MWTGSASTSPPTLARQFHEVDRLAAFFELIQQDPVVSQVKLIAEPWDVGRGRLSSGQLPPTVVGMEQPLPGQRARFLAGRAGEDRARWRCGSREARISTGRTPAVLVASINFVTAHDGFTLNDLVSYNEKHNEANGEHNNDGANDNRSWNCGVEGPTKDPASSECRRRQQRNLLATLMLSQGVPMLLGGDEIGRTQKGNNNADCQDNEISLVRLGGGRLRPARVHVRG